MNASAISANGLDQPVSDTKDKNFTSKPSMGQVVFKAYGDRPCTAIASGALSGLMVGGALGGLFLAGGALMGLLNRK